MRTDFIFFFLRCFLRQLLVRKGTYDETNGGNTRTEAEAGETPEIQDTARCSYVDFCGRGLKNDTNRCSAERLLNCHGSFGP